MLLPGMEKLNNGISNWINRFNMVVFPVVAALTGVGEIIQVVRSSFSDGNNMFHRKGVWRKISLRKAIFTTKASTLSNLFFSGFADAFRHLNRL